MESKPEAPLDHKNEVKLDQKTEVEVDHKSEVTSDPKTEVEFDLKNPSVLTQKTKIDLDRSQVKKAAHALLAFLKTTSKSDTLLTDDAQPISLLFTLWKIPRRAQRIRIPLPFAHRQETFEVCLFTRDEPNMTVEQTQRFYKTLLEQRGVKNITEVIPFKMLKTEYKPFEAKRRLLGNYNMFLSDDRVRRLLPSQIGKHFYERKREPMSVDLTSKNLAKEVLRKIQGTNLKVTNKGSCCMATVGNSHMQPDELTENIMTTVQTVMEKIKIKGPVLKVIHLKSLNSVALPIYTSDLNHLKMMDEIARLVREKRAAKNPNGTKGWKKQTLKKRSSTKAEENKPKDKKEEAVKEVEEEEIPQLVPIETPTKKTRGAGKRQIKKMTPAAAKKRANTAAKADSTVKRKVPKKK